MIPLPLWSKDHNRRDHGKDLSARVWERKQYLLDMTDPLYSWTPAAVVTRTRPVQDQATLHNSMGQEGAPESPPLAEDIMIGAGFWVGEA